jgi:protein involved in polysaccharide export with SLBB domain
MSSVEINLTNLMETVNPAEDLELKPFDIIKASTQAMVYVSGEFGKVGAFDLADRDFLPTTQVLSLAGGVSRDADPAKAIVLRPVLGSAKRATIPVDITKILAGRANDFPLLPNDTLVVPRRGGFLSTTGRNLLVTLIPATVTAVLAAVLVR